MDQLIESATTSMGVGWYQKMSGIKHTGIVVLIDAKPRYTIDFDGYNVNVHEWEDKDRCIHEKFKSVRFELKIMQKLQPNKNTTQCRNAKAKHFMSIVVKSKANKNKANNILKDIQKIKMGTYHAMKNNCRHHVKLVYDMLVEKWGVVSHLFLEKMKEILAEDNKKIAAGVGVFGGAGSIVTAGLCGAATFFGVVTLPVALPLGAAVAIAGAAGLAVFSGAGVGVAHAVSKSSKLCGKKIQSCVVGNSTSNASTQGSSVNAQLNKFHCSFGYNASLLELKDNGVFKGSVWNKRYSKYFQQVHGSSRTDGYDDDMTHFFIIPPNIEIDDENVKEILHDMLMMGMAPSITSVSDKNIDKVDEKVIPPRRYNLVLQQLFKDFGRQLTSDCRVLVFKTTDLIHSEDYTSKAEIIPFKY